MARNFIGQLSAATAAFESAVNEENARRGTRVGTNAAFLESARRGKTLVAKLMPAVKRRYLNDPQKLAEWLVASYVARPAPPKPAAKRPADTDDKK